MMTIFLSESMCKNYVQILCLQVMTFQRKKLEEKTFPKKEWNLLSEDRALVGLLGRARGIAWPCVCGPWLTWPAAPAFKLCLVLKIFIRYNNFECLITN